MARRACHAHRMNIQNTLEISARQSAVAQNPNDPELHVALGNAYFEADEQAHARFAYERAIALDPGSWAAHNAVGHVYYKLNMPTQSVMAYERAIVLDPLNDHPYFGLAILLSTKLADYDGAIAALERGLTANPGSELLRDTVGATHARYGRISAALAVLEPALKKNPKDDYARGWLGLLYLHQKRLADSVAVLSEESRYAASRDGQRMLGYAYAQMGDPATAAGHLRAAVEAAPDDYEARGALVTVCHALGLSNEAAEHEHIAQAQAARDDAYGQACYAAVRGDVEHALTLLAKTFATDGRAQRGWANIDPELTFIAVDKRFQALVQDQGTAAR